MPDDKGGIVDDLIVYKIKDDDYLLVVNAGNIEKDWNWISKFNTDGVDMKDISSDICLFAGANDVVMSNTGYTGSGGFEIYVHKDNAEKVWNALFDAGKDVNIKPIGLGARDTLRLEKGFCLYGNDIDHTTSPLEAGLGWITKFTKEFTNSENLKKQKEEGITRKLVGFKMIDKGIPRYDYEIKNASGEVIGKVTSGTISPMLGIGIGLGYVTVDHSKPETEIFISVRNRDLKAVVSKLPLV